MKYSKLAELYEKLEATTKRLEKTHIISEFLKDVPEDDLDVVCLLIQGSIFPSWDDRKIGVASRLVLKAISLATGMDQDNVEKDWKKTGDLGETTENLITKKRQRTLFSQSLTVKKVYENIRKLCEIEGEGTVDKKVKIISELLTSASPKEARFIVRTVLEDMRVGVGDGTLRDSIVWAFLHDEAKMKYSKEENDFVPEDREKYNEVANIVQKAYDLSTDFGIVAKEAKTKGLAGLKKTQLTIGKPIKVMLYQKAENLKEAFEYVGKPAALEYKYDGFRIQLNKKGKEIFLYTRRLEDVTKQFPEVVQFVKDYVHGDNFILDSEAVGYDPKTKNYLAFQTISQRIKRKYDIEKMAKEFPVEVNVFDVMAFEGENWMNKPFLERRKLLEKIIKNTPFKIITAKQIITDDIKKAEKFYKESLAHGEEGVMVKNLEGIYKPGSRVGYGMKVKPTMENLDLVIVGAEWGEGKRSAWLSSFTLACLDEDKKFVEIGKVGTGIKELEESEGITFAELTKKLKPLVISEKGKEVKVKPEIVLEIGYEEIQKSPSYSSGYALRFPRLIRLRDDKPPSEASTLRMIEKFYKTQRERG